MAKGHKNASNQTTSVKLDDKDYRVWCPECNQPFEAQRSDAVYCSGRCRTHAARAPQRLANTLAFLESLCFTLGNYGRQYKRNKLVFLAFQRLHIMIGHQMALFESEAKD